MQHDWIREACDHWGWQIRLLYCGKDGWMSRSILGKLIEEGVLGASVGAFYQYVPECLDSEALKTNIAIKGLPEEHRTRLFIHHVVVGKGKVKAARMGESRTTYYAKLNDAYSQLGYRFSTQFEQEQLKKTARVNNNAPICSPFISAVAA